MGVRCFISIDVEDEEILSRILKAQRALEGSGADLKLVEPQNIHVTLKFLGEVGEGKLEEVVEALKAVEFEPFRIALRGLGAFPSPGRPRVVWIGVAEGAEETSSIYLQLEDKLAKLGFPKEGRGFTPHLTIARVKSGRGREGLLKVLQALKDEEFGRMPVKGVRLKKSVLTPRGPIYSTLFERKPKV